LHLRFKALKSEVKGYDDDGVYKNGFGPFTGTSRDTLRNLGIFGQGLKLRDNKPGLFKGKTPKTLGFGGRGAF